MNLEREDNSPPRYEAPKVTQYSDEAALDLLRLVVHEANPDIKAFELPNPDIDSILQRVGGLRGRNYKRLKELLRSEQAELTQVLDTNHYQLTELDREHFAELIAKIDKVPSNIHIVQNEEAELLFDPITNRTTPAILARRPEDGERVLFIRESVLSSPGSARSYSQLSSILAWAAAQTEYDNNPGSLTNTLLRGIGFKIGTPLEATPEQYAVGMLARWRHLHNMRAEVENIALVPVISVDHIIRNMLKLGAAPNREFKLLKSAYEFARDEHGQTQRDSGLSTFAFASRTARTTAWLGASEEAVAAALLTGLDPARRSNVATAMALVLPEHNHKRIAKLLDYATGLDQLERDPLHISVPDDLSRVDYGAYYELNRQVQRINQITLNLKSEVAALDLLKIHFAAVLQDINSLRWTDNPEILREVVEETLLRDAPTAERLGMSHTTRRILHDLFRATQPDEYMKIQSLQREHLGMSWPQSREFIRANIAQVESALISDYGLSRDSFMVLGNEKSYQSTSEKISERRKQAQSDGKDYGIEDVPDLIRYMIVIDSLADMEVIRHGAYKLFGKRPQLTDSKTGKISLEKPELFSNGGNITWQRGHFEFETPYAPGRKLIGELQVLTREQYERYVRGSYGMFSRSHTALKLMRRAKNVIQARGRDVGNSSFKIAEFERPEPALSGKLEVDLDNLIDHCNTQLYVKFPTGSATGKNFQDTSFKTQKLPNNAIAVDFLYLPDVDCDPRTHEVWRIQFAPRESGSSNLLIESESRLLLGDSVLPGDTLVARPREKPITAQEQSDILSFSASTRANLALNTLNKRDRKLVRSAGREWLENRFGQLNHRTLRKIIQPLNASLGLKNLSELSEAVGMRIVHNDPSLDLNSIERWYGNRFVGITAAVNSDNTLSIYNDESQIGIMAEVAKVWSSLGLRVKDTQVKESGVSGTGHMRLSFYPQGMSQEVLTQKLQTFSERVNHIHRERGGSSSQPMAHERQITLFLNVRTGSLYKLADFLASHKININEIMALAKYEQDKNGESFQKIAIKTSGPGTHNDEYHSERSRKQESRWLHSKLKSLSSTRSARHGKLPLVLRVDSIKELS